MKIIITHSADYGFKVSNDAGEHTGPLCFDEMLGQVVSICWPLVRRRDGRPRYAMHTDADWASRFVSPQDDENADATAES